MGSLWRSLHILGIALLAGGIITLRLVVFPRLPAENPEHPIETRIWHRWRWLAWFSMALTIVAGFGMVIPIIQIGGMPFSYWLLMIVKAVLVVCLLGWTMLITAPMRGLKKFEEEKRRWMTWIAALTILVLFLSSWMAYLHQTVGSSSGRSPF